MSPRHQEADALAATKFSPPRAPAGWVDRPRLVAALEEGLQGPLTLLAAGAGAGKSALLGAWAAQRTCDAARSPGSRSSPPTPTAARFWRAVFEALRRAGADEPVASLALHPAEDVGLAIPALVNALETLGEPRRARARRPARARRLARRRRPRPAAAPPAARACAS